MAYTRPAHAHPQAVGYRSIHHHSPEHHLIEEVLRDIYSADINGTTYELVKLGNTLDFIVSGKVVTRHLRNKGGELLRIEMGIVFHYEIKQPDPGRDSFGFPFRHGAGYDIDDEFSLAVFGEDGELIIAIFGNYPNSPVGTDGFRSAVASHYHMEMLCAQHLYRDWQSSGIPERLKALEVKLRSQALDRALVGFSTETLESEVARVLAYPFEDAPVEGSAPEGVSS